MTEEKIVKEVTEQPVKVEEVVKTEEPTKVEMVSGMVIDCAKLNVRKQPNLKADVLCEVAVRAKLIINPAKSTKEWYCVRTEQGVVGYCMKKYIKVKQ